MKLNIKQFGVTLLCLQMYSIAFAQQITEVNTPNTSIGYHLITGEHIVAPGSQTSTVNITQSAQVDYKAGEVIELKNGFSAGGFNGNGFFHAFIDPHVSMPVDYDDNLFSQQDFDNHEIDVSKPVGYIPGTHSVTPTGAASYTIPIPLPPGTSSMVPSLAISYNSQSGNGILGMGWNISGISAISRVPKTIYHNNKVEAVQLDEMDNFALDGNRLIKVGDYYYTEAETFSRIRGESVSGSAPQGFEVETKNGQRIYYGYTPDSRFYKENTNEILFWLISKVKDNYGNYVEFTYRQENREVVIDKISYTGNENAGLTPYNHIQFYYDYRDDKNTVYLAGASISSNLILKKIKITADGQDFKIFKFIYGLNLYSFLKEVQEFGSDGSEVNSTVFKYGDAQNELNVSQSNVITGQSTDVFAADFNGDGYSDILSANFEFLEDPPFLKYHTNHKLYLNNGNDNGTSYSLTNSEDFPLENYEIENFKLTNNIGIVNSDFDGDGKDDLVITDKSFNGNYSELHKVIISNSYYGNYFSGSSEWTADNSFNRIHPSQKFFYPGDFDGDGAIDFITILSDGIGYKAFVTFPRISYSNIEISNFDPNYAVQSPDIIVIDFDGDGKHELLVIDEVDFYGPDYSKIYTFSRTGNYVSASNIYTGGFPTQWHTIYPADFNGDGKTDLLSKVNDDDWFVSYSNGATGFDTHDFTFNYFNSSNSSFLKTGDYNGDGKSDILYAAYDYNNQESWIETYYSKGSSFEYKHQIFSDLINVLISGDFNGDGKQDEINRGYYGNPVKILLFNKDSKERLLEKVKNGLNSVISFNHTWLSKGTNYLVGTSNTIGDIPGYPVNDFKKALQVVSSITVPDGIGNNNLITYHYEEGTFHKQGKGFLGFKKITLTNYNLNSKTVSEYETNNTHFVSYLKNQKSLTLNNSIISEAENTNNVISLNNYKRYWSKLSSTNSYDHLNSFSNSVSYSYDNYGNIIQATTDLGGVENTVAHYENFVANGSWIPSRPLIETKTNTRGSESFTKTIHYTYNSQGSVSSEIAFPGMGKSVTTLYEQFDDFGNILETKVSNPNLTDRTIRLEYDDKGRFIIKKYNTLNQHEDYTYDVRWGEPLTTKGIEGLITTFEYDGFGGLIKTTDSHNLTTTVSYHWDVIGNNGSSNATIADNILYYIKTHKSGQPDIKTWYDLYGREIKTEAEGFDGQQIITVQKFDVRGNIKTKTSPFYQGETPVVTTYNYDNFNRLESVTNDAGTTSYAYLSGNGVSSVTITNPAQQQTTKVTDASGKISAAGDAGGLMNYYYDGAGNLLKTILVNDATEEIVRMEYDDYGRQTKLIDKNGGTSIYIYNAYGELEKQTDASGHSYTLEYDQLGSIISKSGPEGITSYQYYSSGNGINKLKKVTAPNNSYQEYVYDSFERISQIKEGGIDNELFTTTYSYDNLDNITSVTYPSGFKINKFYNSRGYLTTISDANGNENIYSTGEISSLGQLKEYTLGNSITTQKTFDQYGFLRNISAAGVQNLDLNFNVETGNLDSRDDNTKSLSEYFTYDELNRLKTTQVGNNNTQQLGSLNSISYSYNGNISSKTGTGDYYYESALPNAVTAVSNNNQPIPNISTLQQDLTYTSFDRTESVTENGLELFYTYGPDYNRKKSVLRQVQGSTINTRYYSASYEKLIINGADSYEIHYINAGDGLCAIYVTENGNQNGNYYYVYKDHLGSILTLTDTEGNIVHEQNYDAWGRERDPDEWDYDFSNYTSLTLPPDLSDPGVWLARGFTGHEHLREFALINMNGRMYDPLLGRMLAVDNFIQSPYSSQSYNRFTYVFNNPLRYVDPSGEYAGVDDLIAMGIGGIYNLGMNLVQGNVTGLGDGIAYFVIGAAAGEATLYAGPLAGAAILGLGNNLTYQVAHNGWENIDAGQAILATGMSVATSFIGGAVSGYISPYVSNMVSGIGSPIISGAVSGAITNSLAGFGVSSIMSLATGNGMGQAFSDGLDGFATGFGMGLITGTSLGIINAKARGIDPITGQSKNQLTPMKPISVKEIRTEPSNLAEQLTLKEAMSGQGAPIMGGRIKNPDASEWTKMSHTHKLPENMGTIEIHYWKNIITGETFEFKFKNPPLTISFIKE